ncbi:MAG TPA: hypothetical protein VGR64_07925 [Terracidiphilus sp.]|nr:hypothetical protein [Terracidiphilus sp.]
MQMRAMSWVLAVIAGCGACAAQAGQPLVLVRRIPLAGVQGRIDHLSADVEGKRLFVSALGNGTVEVIDARTGQRTGEITGLERPQGVLYDAAVGRVFVASDGDGTLRSYNGKTLKPLATAQLGDDADNVRYDAQRGLVLVGYGGGGVAGFDAELKKKLDVPTPGHPESFQVETKGTRMFVNVPEARLVGVWNAQDGRRLGTWPDEKAHGNFPMALDERDGLVLVGFRQPATLEVLDAKTGTLMNSAEIVSDTDDVFFDAQRGRVYAIGGGGAVDVFALTAGKLSKVQTVETRGGARTGLFVPACKRLFVAVPRQGGAQAELLEFRVQ